MGYVSLFLAVGLSNLHSLGLTETCVVATLTSAHDVWHGSSGSLLPGCQLRLIGPGGEEVDNYNEAGEVLFKAPNVFVGYLGDEESTNKTLDADGWLHTGDVGAMQINANGTEHLFIRDRIKDMIKVKVSRIYYAGATLLVKPFADLGWAA